MNFKYLAMNASLSLLMALPAFGAQKEMVTVVPRTHSVIEGSSEHKRINQDYMVTTQLLGFAVAPFFGLGLNLGMYLDRNDILQLEMASGVLPLIIANVRASVVGVNWKHFYGNSFYTKLGVDHRSITVENLDYENGQFTNSTVVGTANALTGNIAIGNQWQWDSFTMGCDWIGFNPSVLTLESKYRTTNMDPDEARDLNREWKSVAKTNSYQFMRFYLGASF
ncbi:hypothetical protein [Bdellovibrio sp. HCB337]|uniref:hypothetical protein n=1 Tax=Bdellovibrio sp. HCB337 TaxID=3394358 RepID=UPI0039A67D42